VVTVTNANGCTAVDTVIVYSNKQNLFTAITGNLNISCTNPTTTLTAIGGVSFVWSTGETTESISVSPTTNTRYFVTITASNGCAAVESALVKFNNVAPVSCPQNITVNTNVSDCFASNFDLGQPTTVGVCPLTFTAKLNGIPVTSSTPFSTGKSTVTWSVVDAFANTSICIQEVTVKDATSPVLTAAPDQNVSLNSTCQITIPDVRGTATDNCAATITQSPAAGSLISSSHNVTTDVIVTATDAAGNTDVKTVVLTAKDVTKPTLTAAPNQNVNLDSLCQITVPDVRGTATDNCAGVSIAQVPAAGSVIGSAHNQTTSVTVTATDAAGNTTVKTVVLTAKDSFNPVLTAASNQDVTMNSTCKIAVPDVRGTATDNCVVTISQVPAIGALVNTSHNATTNVVVTATDAAGNTDVKIVVLTAKDVTAPILTAGVDRNVSLDVNCKITVPDVRGSVTDNCGAIITQAPAIGTIINSSHSTTTSVVVTATDAAGNTDVKTVILTAIDVSNPVLTAAPDRNVTLDSACQLIVPDVRGTATDNCIVTISQVPAIGTALNSSHNSTVSVIVTATDAAGNTDVKTVVLTAKDETAPVLTAAPNQSVLLDGGCQIVIPDVRGTATDNCAGTTIAQIPVAGSILSAVHDQTIDIVVTATDAAGNKTSKTVVVTAKDNINPVFVTATVPSDVTITCADYIKDHDMAEMDVEATDNCGGVYVTLQDVSTQSGNPNLCSYYSYTLTRTWTATDDAGNTSTARQVITVQDKTAPVLSAGPAYLVTALTRDSLPKPATLTAVDNCFNPVSVVYAQAAPIKLTLPPCISYRDSIARTWTATDACGNSSVFTQWILSTGSVLLYCPKNLTLGTNSDGYNDYNCSTFLQPKDGVTITFSDACDSTVLRYKITGATSLMGSGTISGSRLNKGVNNVQYIAGSNSCNFTVTIMDDEKPKISNPSTTATIVTDACTFGSMYAVPTATDNCSAVNFSSSSTDVDVSGCSSKSPDLKYIKQRTIQWSATDASGNIANTVQRIFLRDKVPPVAVCKDITVAIPLTQSSVTVPASSFNNGSYDACSALTASSFSICNANSNANCTNFTTSLSFSKTSVPVSGAYIQNVRIKVVDACLNTSYCTAKITVVRATSMENSSLPNNASATSDSPNGIKSAVPSEVVTAHGDMKCFPNPFADELNINYNLTNRVERVVLKLYDNQGKVVSTIDQGESVAGYYSVRWNLSELKSGMYHVCLEFNNKCQKVQRVLMMK